MMTPIVCNHQTRGRICTQILLRIDLDFTGRVEVKCPRCRHIHTYTIRLGAVTDVA